MNAPHYVLAKVQLMIRFETRFPLYTHGCAMFASTKLLDKREKGLLSSQFEQLGWFCNMSASTLPQYTSLAWVFLAYREYGQWKGDWQCYKHLLPQYHMSWDKPMLLDRNHTSVLHECSPVRVCKGAAYDPVSNKNFLYTLVICTWLCHVACIHKTLGQERERTSHFTLEQFRWFSDMSASRLPEYDSLAWVFLA